MPICLCKPFLARHVWENQYSNKTRGWPVMYFWDDGRSSFLAADQWTDSICLCICFSQTYEARSRTNTHTHTYAHTHTDTRPIYIHMLTCRILKPNIPKAGQSGGRAARQRAARRSKQGGDVDRSVRLERHYSLCLSEHRIQLFWTSMCDSILQNTHFTRVKRRKYLYAFA